MANEMISAMAEQDVELPTEEYPVLLMLPITELQVEFIMAQCDLDETETLTPGNFVRLLIDAARSPKQ